MSRGGSDPHNSNFLAKIAKRFFRRSRPILRLRAKKKLPRAACNGNTRLVGSQGSTETYPSTTRTCITRLGYFPAHWHPTRLGSRYSDIPLVGGSRLSLLTIIIPGPSPSHWHLLLTDAIPRMTSKDSEITKLEHEESSEYKITGLLRTNLIFQITCCISSLSMSIDLRGSLTQ